MWLLLPIAVAGFDPLPLDTLEDARHTSAFWNGLGLATGGVVSMGLGVTQVMVAQPPRGVLTDVGPTQAVTIWVGAHHVLAGSAAFVVGGTVALTNRRRRIPVALTVVPSGLQVGGRF